MNFFKPGDKVRRRTDIKSSFFKYCCTRKGVDYTGVFTVSKISGVDIYLSELGSGGGGWNPKNFEKASTKKIIG